MIVYYEYENHSRSRSRYYCCSCLGCECTSQYMNTKIILAVVLAIIVVAAWAVNAHRNKGFKTVASEEFAQIIGDTATVQLLDVRTKEEYEEGHIADALLVDFYSYNFEEQATAKLSKEKAVAVYCRLLSQWPSQRVGCSEVGEAGVRGHQS